ncbi:hypothetical protein GCM10029963_14150 [Micromonospora andamanensis]
MDVYVRPRGHCRQRDTEPGRPKLRPMARYLDVHPDNPQPRIIGQLVEIIRGDGLIAYPTDSCYALGSRLGNKEGMDRIRRSASSTAATISRSSAATSPSSGSSCSWTTRCSGR